MAMTVTPLGGNFGAEISGIDLARPLDEDAAGGLERAFLDYRVIAIRGQRLDVEQVVAVSRRFGDLESHVFAQYHHPDTPLVMVLSNRVENGREVGLADAGSFWHSDVSYKPCPAKATLLYALEVPGEGGDTLFCDMVAAYDALSRDMKATLRGRTAVHQYGHATHRPQLGAGERTASMKRQEGEIPPAIHPVVRTHPETGRKALYVNPAYTVRIEGLAEEESEALKQDIFAHCLQDRFMMRYSWRAGDVVLWDNSAVMHSATTRELDPANHRTIWRTIISGGPTF